MSKLNNYRDNNHLFASQSGVALLMVLWVLTLLMVIVLSFSFTARTETQSTLAFKEGIEKRFLAEAGIERGIIELFYRKQNRTVPGSEVWKTDGTIYKDSLGSGYFSVSIRDESGKVDINMVSEVLLKNILINSGVSVEEADSIVDAIMDWKDKDDLHRLHGAESDYYMSLPASYKAKNADFDTLEELLLVKGITGEILYGSAEKKGIIDLITVNSRSNKININAAPREVLAAIPGMSPELADAVITYRESMEISNIQEVQGIIGSAYSLASPYINTAGTSTYTIKSIGHKGSDIKGYGITAAITIEGNNKYKYKYYKSPGT